MEIQRREGVRGQGKRTKGSFCLMALFQGNHDLRTWRKVHPDCPEVRSLCSLSSVEPKGGLRAQGGAQAPTGLPHPGVGPLSFCLCEMGRKCLSDSLQRQVLRGVTCSKLAPGRCTNHHQAASLAIPRNGPGAGTGSNRSRVLPVNAAGEVGGL